jgi:hypothetical protein
MSQYADVEQKVKLICIVSDWHEPANSSQEPTQKRFDFILDKVTLSLLFKQKISRSYLMSGT